MTKLHFAIMEQEQDQPQSSRVRPFVLLIGLGVLVATICIASLAFASIPGGSCDPTQCYEEVPCADVARNCWEIPTQSIGRPATFCTAAGCKAGTIRRGRELCAPTPDAASAYHHGLYEITAENLPSPLPPVPFEITAPGVSALVQVKEVGKHGVQLHVLANKSLVAPFPLTPPTTPAWLCYRATQVGQTSFTVVAPDQFGTPIVKVGNLTELCVAGSFDGTPVTGGLAFACFAGGQQKPLVNPPKVWVSDPVKQWTADVHPDHQGFCVAAGLI